MLRTRLLRALTVLTVAVFLGGCGADSETPSVDRDTTPTTEAAANTCVAPTYTVEAPDGWLANDPGEASPCRYFDSEPFEVPQNTEPVGIAILLGYENVPFETAATPSEQVAEVLDQRDDQIDSLPAKRLHLRSTGEALLDKDTEYIVWLIKVSEQRHFSGVTIQRGPDFGDNTEALDQMVRSLEFTVDGACSAAGMDIPEPGADFPAPVTATRARILEAAVACDYESLAEIAGEQEHFTYSYGDDGDFRSFLHEGETSGSDPLRSLVLIFGMSSVEDDLSNRGGWIWPSAASYDNWESIPQPQKDELRRIYDQHSLDSFEQNGGYIGYRTSIDPEGIWRYFVAGD